ncbi:MAG TPA: phosphoribosylglycinamide formyltransferase [Cellvibrionaceae bacterium]
MTHRPIRIVVLISGSGSNLQALIDAQRSGQLHGAVIAGVISNRPGVKGLERAAAAGIATITVDHTRFSNREDFDTELAQLIDSFTPDLVVLAGFMRILTAAFTRRYLGRMLNIHPSLLPKYQGLHTHQRVLEAGDSEHGVTVHFVTAELDGGPAVIQATVPIQQDDDATALAARVQTQEHIIYPMAVGWFAQGRLSMHNNQALLDGEPLPICGYQVKA